MIRIRLPRHVCESVGLLATMHVAGCHKPLPVPTASPSPSPAVHESKAKFLSRGTDLEREDKKWAPVFGKQSRDDKDLERDDDTTKRLQDLADAIAAGDERAIAGYQAARARSDAADAEALDSAIALALPRQPRLVLDVLDHGVAVETVCTSPFIEPAHGVEAAYFAAVRKALRPLAADPRFASKRQRCLAALDRIAPGAFATP